MRDTSPEVQALLDEFRAGPCEVCGRPGGTDPHHLHTVGAGEANVRQNLMAVCRSCHTRIGAGNISHHALLCIVAIREGCQPEDIREVVWAVRRKNGQRKRRNPG